MNIKKKLVDHPLSLIVSVVIATCGITYSVTEYFTTRKIENINDRHFLELSKRDLELESMKSRLNKGKDFDISKLLLRKGENITLPSNTRFFSSGNFYAPLVNNYWLYEESDILSLHNSLIKNKLSSENSPIDFVSINNSTTLHLWRYRKTLPVEGAGNLNALFTHISVLIVPKSILDNFLAFFFLNPPPWTTEMYSFWIKDEKLIHFFNEMKNSFNIHTRDPLSTLFQIVLNGKLVYAYLSEKKWFYSELQVMQKEDKFVYAEFITTLNDVKVDNVSYTRFFIRQKFILISVGTSLYMIQTFVPGPEPAARGKHNAKVNEWLASFAIIGD